MSRKLQQIKEWHQKNIRGISEDEWHFGLSDDEWWNTVFLEGKAVKILKDGEEYLAGLYEYGGTYHVLGFEERLPTTDIQNTLFDVEREIGEKVLDYVAFKRHNLSERSTIAGKIASFIDRHVSEDWSDMVEEKSDTTEADYIEASSVYR